MKSSKKVNINIFSLHITAPLDSRTPVPCSRTPSMAMKQIAAFIILKAEEKVKLDFLAGQNLID